MSGNAVAQTGTGRRTRRHAVAAGFQAVGSARSLGLACWLDGWGGVVASSSEIRGGRGLQGKDGWVVVVVVVQECDMPHPNNKQGVAVETNGPRVRALLAGFVRRRHRESM